MSNALSTRRMINHATRPRYQNTLVKLANKSLPDEMGKSRRDASPTFQFGRFAKEEMDYKFVDRETRCQRRIRAKLEIKLWKVIIIRW